MCKYEKYCDYTQYCPICKDYKFYYKSQHYKNSKKNFNQLRGSSKAKKWNKKEVEFANNIDAKQTLGSGRVFGDGDIKNEDVQMEIKYTDKDYIILKKEWFEQLEREKYHRYGMLGISNHTYDLYIFPYSQSMTIDIDEIVTMKSQKRLNVAMLKKLKYDKFIIKLEICNLNKKYVIIESSNFLELGGVGWIEKIMN